MDARSEYTCEMLLRALLSHANEQSSLLSVLSEGMRRAESGMSHIGGDVAIIKNQTIEINQKMDNVLQKLDALENAFSDLKEESRSLDQKMVLMASKLDKIESNIQAEELEDYYALCQNLYNNWDELEELTRKMIPVAEFLYSSLQKYKKPDYSPVILELCRGLETELLLKIFSKYTKDLVNRKRSKIYQFLSTDSSSQDLKRKTGLFVKAVKNHANDVKNQEKGKKMVKDKNPAYTLGQMNIILSMMNDSETVKASPLLQDFKQYLEHEKVSDELLDAQYIKQINDLVEKYRNPSAHPGFMPIDKAKECKDIMPERLDYLMDCMP